MILTILDDGNSNNYGYDDNDDGGGNLQLSYNFNHQDLEKEIRNTISEILMNVKALLIIPTISKVSFFSDTYKKTYSKRHHIVTFFIFHAP